MSFYRASEISAEADLALKKYNLYFYKSDQPVGISAFVLEVKDEAHLSAVWKEVADVIFIEYQSKLESGFPAWNVYLLFLSSSSIGRSVKYTIENDKFAMRKLVVEHDVIIDSEMEHIEILNEKILGADLVLNENIESPSSSVQPSEIRTMFARWGEIPSDNKAESKIKREQALRALLDGVRTNEI